MNGVTMELIELQTLCLAHEESLIDNNGNYKKVPEAFKVLSNVWGKIKKEEEKKYMTNLIGLK
jgi:hypothetical protein